MLVELIDDGMEAQTRKQQQFFELAERFRSAADPEEAKRLGDDLGRMVFRRLMPKIETWDNLPLAVRRHLIERMRDRSISLADLNQLRLWEQSKPQVPDGDCYKDFGSFKVCGQGPYPKTFLLRGQGRKGVVDLTVGGRRNGGIADTRRGGPSGGDRGLRRYSTSD